MDSETETEVSSLISTPCATPTHTKVENPTIIQSQPDSTKGGLRFNLIWVLK